MRRQGRFGDERPEGVCGVYDISGTGYNMYVLVQVLLVSHKPRKTGHRGKKGKPPLSEGVPYEITLMVDA